jgi:flagellar biosynthetic protein FlhB
MGKREGKTEAPTQKKKKDARKKGTVTRSQDLAPWLMLLVATYLIPWVMSSTGRAITSTLSMVRDLSREATAVEATKVLGTAMQAAIFAVVPFLIAISGMGLLVNLAQTKALVSFHPLKPDFNRVNPLKGLKKMVSPNSLWDLAKQLAKSGLVAWLAWPHMTAVFNQLLSRGRVPLMSGLSLIASESLAMTRTICWAILVLAIVDYAYQRRNTILDLKMTKQEVRDEMRNSEGDAQMKGRIRSLQMSMSRNRMMAAVPSASVVVTNPTHVAVALLYDPQQGGAPKVVACGVGALAAKIRERAIDAGVPIVEAKPLARALYRSCDVGDEVPAVLYEAVAKVLAFVRRLRGTLVPASPMPLPRTYHVEQSLLDAIQGNRRRRLPA